MTERAERLKESDPLKFKTVPSGTRFFNLEGVSVTPLNLDASSLKLG